ncbi:MAG: TetR/AcrR family transcriptional regulator [Bryobacterales bacterium]|nr:TetR/AcrR family transcriptional regulator [Bryobacteraceae bacterium]MDW8353758.1 TetR/AcrR family transcriptional regulator [Bryobacterales bacterium]
MHDRSAREAIRQAAIELFAEKGFAATSTREICERARVTKPVLYYHFESKDQLYRELLLDACNESRKQILLAAQRGKTVREKLTEVLAAEFELTRKNPSLSVLFFRVLFAPRREAPNLDYVQLGKEWLSVLAGIVTEGIERGEIRGSALAIAEALTGIQMIYTLGYLLAGEPPLDRNLARRIVDLLFDGCSVNPTGRKAK